LKWAVDPVADVVTTAGDLLYATAADTVTRLGIGTAGQVLKVNSGATAPEWGAAAGGGTLNWTAVNSGGTALTGAATITISGITDANHLLVSFLGASSSAANAEFEININSDTGTNYYYGGSYQAGSTTDWNGSGTTGTTRIRLGGLSSDATKVGYGYALISGGATSGVKAFEASWGANGAGVFGSSVGGYWNNSATITSVSVKVTAGDFDAGTIFVFKSA
jgi:hypothetical protein